jgi:hypothetical protein
VVSGRNFEPGKEVLAEKDAMVPLHIEELDGENVGGAIQFFARKDQRRVISVVDPPFRGGVESFQLAGSGTVDEAKNVQVGMTWPKLAGSARAIEHRGFEIASGRGLQSIYQFSKFCFHLRRP